MKINNLKNLVTILLISIFFSACQKDGTVASIATFLPEVIINGDELLVVVKDSPYEELGAVAKENGTEIDYVISGNVDVSTPGIYVLEYSATNVDGFDASAIRTVIVIPGIVTNDVSYIEGTYVTSPNGGTPATTFATITKIKPGVYYTTNCWGNGSLAVLPAYFFCLDGETLEIPKQGDGGAQVVTQNGPGLYDTSINKISWRITRPLFGSGPLTVNKSWTKV